MGFEQDHSGANGVSGTDTPGETDDALEPPIRRPSVQRDPQVESMSSYEEKPNKQAPNGVKSNILTEKHHCSHKEQREVPDLDSAHVCSTQNVAGLVDTCLESGLSENEALSRLERYGPNKVNEPKATPPWEIFMRQISNSLTLVLVITMGVSFGIDDYIEGSVIAAVIMLNIVIGFVQDFRAEQQILSLQALSAPESKVLRSGVVRTIKAEKLVVGDVVKFTVGDVIPADLRLIDGINISVDEAILTGESLPVVKDPWMVLRDQNASIGDRINMCYAATTVTMGRGTAIVVSTGMATEVGKIAGMLRQSRQGSENMNPVIKTLVSIKNGIKNILGLTGTPLQVKLSKFALILFALAITLAIIVFSANLWDIDGEVLIYGICVAVAVIPESLIAVLTITVAVGTKAMAKGNVIVRRLASLEAVGGVNAICSDKTGTLTQGKMIVRKAWIPSVGTYTVHETGNPFDPTSGFVRMDGEAVKTFDFNSNDEENTFFPAIALCNLSAVYNSKVIKSSGDTFSTTSSGESWMAVGEPTEIALQVFAMRFEYGKPALLSDGNRRMIAEFPFDSTIKRMTVIYENERTGMAEVFTKGASEALVPLLSISEQEKRTLLEKADRLAEEGLRVLCIAHKYCAKNEESQFSARTSAESRLIFDGFVGLYDPPRPETTKAVKVCHEAGIDVHMLTGDHVGTARSVAQEIGIFKEQLKPDGGIEKVVMKAEAFDKLSDGEIDQLETLPLVLARCSPATKVRMVDALKRRGKFCVMTGDGVNDSPSLKQADVGIAMGMNGTDVAKDASDMILTDDNFASIVKAVEEGRRLFDNIQKFLMHLLISNIAQVILLLIGLAFTDSEGHSVFPLSPLEILWVNLITSSFLAIGLGLEESIPDIMQRPPHDLKIGVFTRELIMDKMVYGTFMGSLCLAAFVSVSYGTGDGHLGLGCNAGWNETCDVTFRARATTWATLTLLLLVTALEVKHFTRSLFALDPERYDRAGMKSIFGPLWRNKFLFWAVAAGFVIAFPVIYLPVVNKTVFKHKGITWEWGTVLACLIVYVGLVETWKAVKRRFGIGTKAAKINQFVTA